MRAKEFICESAEGITDEWFSDGFQTYKKPAIEKYTISDKDQTIQTLEGPVRAPKGHYIMTGPKGEQYPISPEKFAGLKNDHGDGTACPKKIIKVAKLADHDGVVHASWGDLAYTSGNDYVVKHGPGDYGVVKKDIFAITYARA
jgi:hypothetical protein